MIMPFVIWRKNIPELFNAYTERKLSCASRIIVYSTYIERVEYISYSKHMYICKYMFITVPENLEPYWSLFRSLEANERKLYDDDFREYKEYTYTIDTHHDMI